MDLKHRPFCNVDFLVPGRSATSRMQARHVLGQGGRVQPRLNPFIFKYPHDSPLRTSGAASSERTPPLAGP